MVDILRIQIFLQNFFGTRIQNSGCEDRSEQKSLQAGLLMFIRVRVIYSTFGCCCVIKKDVSHQWKFALLMTGYYQLIVQHTKLWVYSAMIKNGMWHQKSRLSQQRLKKSESSSRRFLYIVMQQIRSNCGENTGKLWVITFLQKFLRKQKFQTTILIPNNYRDIFCMSSKKY